MKKFKDIFKKKRSIEDELFDLDSMDFEEMSREDCTPERRKELRFARQLTYKTLADMHIADTEMKKGIIVAGIGAGATLLTGIGVFIWNTVQHDRNMNPDDESQMDMNRDGCSSAKTGGRILEKLFRK